MPNTSMIKLLSLGLVATNSERVDQALNHLHSAICQMDQHQLQLLPHSEFGILILNLCNQFADMSDNLAKFEISTSYKHLCHFGDVHEVCEFIKYELLETLQEDLLRMQTSERQHYTDEDRMEMRNKISDVTTISPYISIKYSITT